MPKISVIIPAYNRANLLPRTIKSVLDQTFKDFELIVIDDGSTDNTKEVVEQFVHDDGRIKYLHQKNSGGAAGPKNSAITHCSGKYIAYLDHDDEWFPEKLEKQYDFFERSSSKNLGLVSCNVLIINKDKGMEGVHRMSKYKSVEDLLLRGGDYAFSNSSIMIPRTVIDKVGPRDESLKIFEDQDLFIRIALAGYTLDFVDDVLIKYYIDAANLSKDFRRAAPDYERFVAKHEALLKKYPKILAIHYRHLGTMHFLAGETSEARASFLRSVRIDPSFRNIATACCSLLGKDAYLFLLDLKKRKSLLSY